VAKPLERRRSERFEVNAELAELEPGSVAYVGNIIDLLRVLRDGIGFQLGHFVARSSRSSCRT